MTNLNLLQKRINELNSAILNFSNNKVYITGFYSPEMLLLHLNENSDNHQSKGIYDQAEINFLDVQNKALFIIQEDGIETKRIQYQRVFKDFLNLRDSRKKLIVSIYKNIFSAEYVLRTETRTYSFQQVEKLYTFIEHNYIATINLEGSGQNVYSSN